MRFGIKARKDDIKRVCDTYAPSQIRRYERAAQRAAIPSATKSGIYDKPPFALCAAALSAAVPAKEGPSYPIGISGDTYGARRQIAQNASRDEDRTIIRFMKDCICLQLPMFH